MNIDIAIGVGGFAALLLGILLWLRHIVKFTPPPPRAAEAIAILCATYKIKQPNVSWVRNPKNLNCADGKGFLSGATCTAGTWAPAGITVAYKDGTLLSDGGLSHEFGHEAAYQRHGIVWGTGGGHSDAFYAEDQGARMALKAQGL